MCTEVKSKAEVTVKDVYGRPRYPGTEFVYWQMAVFTPTELFRALEDVLVTYCGLLRTRETWPKLVVVPDGMAVEDALEEIA